MPHVYYMCNTCVAFYVYCTFITHVKLNVYYRYILHMYYMYRTCILHMYLLHIFILHVYYMCNSVKLLGIKIDRHVTFKEQISNVCRKAGLQLSVLKRLSFILNTNMKMAARHSFIKCHLQYCPLVWANQSKGGMSSLEKLQEGVWDLFTITTLLHMWTFLERYTYPQFPLHGNKVQLLKYTRHWMVYYHSSCNVCSH